MKNIYKLFFLCLFCFSMSGCSTIIKGSKQNITINSNPAQATIYVNGKLYGKTPAIARLERRNNHFVKIELDGYKPYETTLQRKFNGWIFGNIVFGGVLGIIIDAATGSMYSLSPKLLTAQLNGTGSVHSSLEKYGDDIYLGVVLHADPTWTKIGELEKE